MEYLFAILAVVLFSAIYVLSYLLNSKIIVDCDKNICEGCKVHGCIDRHVEEE